MSTEFRSASALGPRVIGEEAFRAQQHTAAVTGGHKLGWRVTGYREDGTAVDPATGNPLVSTGAPVADEAEPVEPPTDAPESLKLLGVALSEHPEWVHVLASLELQRDEGPRKGGLLALRAVAEGRRDAGDADAAALVADLDTALGA